MGRPMTVSQSVVIAVDPDTVYRHVSDPTQTGRWSPENLGGTPDSAGELAVGSTFVGRNRRGWMRWATRCRVTAAETGRRFAFRVEAIGLRTPRVEAPIASWSYDLEQVPGGTRVVETWTDDRTRWPDGAAKIFDKLATRSSFHEFNERNMRRTLDRLKDVLESAATAGSVPPAEG